jgi:succinylglutamate desuccinylase
VSALRILESLPHGLLDADIASLEALLGGPGLIHLPGRRPEPLFVTVLLHGNETTGFEAVKSVLRRWEGKPLPRALSLFIGNVAAARAGLRRLPGQPDWNRVWPGTETPDLPEAALMAQVVAHMRGRRPFASIDIHNNTGINPHYACVVRSDPAFLHLARLFGRIAVLFERPLGVQASALADLCPAVTVECGKVGGRSGVEHAAEFIEAALHLDHFPPHGVAAHDIELLQTVAIVRVPAEATFSFDGGAADFRFRGDLDHLNFREMKPGAAFGHRAPGSAARLLELPGGSSPLEEACFDYADGEIRLVRPLVPAMLTTDPLAVRNDCLCYLMRRISF